MRTANYNDSQPSLAIPHLIDAVVLEELNDRHAQVFWLYKPYHLQQLGARARVDDGRVGQDLSRQVVLVHVIPAESMKQQQSVVSLARLELQPHFRGQTIYLGINVGQASRYNRLTRLGLQDCSPVVGPKHLELGSQI